jgi:hypothetical protein
MAKAFCILLTLILTAASAAVAAPPLTANGWGKLRIGMSERQAARRFHLRIPRSDGADSFECRQDEIPSQEGLFVMAERGIITRISIEAPSALRTDRGLELGSTEAAVRRAYGQALETETTPYDDEPAHKLTFWVVRGKRGIRYDTNVAGVVVAIYVGSPSINYIEGCS